MLGRKDARNGGLGRLSSAWISLKTGLFGCMFIMSKKANTSSFRTRVDLLIRVVQMLGFVLTSKYGAPWPASMAPVELMFNVFNANFLQRWYKYQLYLVAYYIAFAWVVLLVSLLSYGITGFIRNKFPSLLPLRALQFIGNLSAGPLYIPLLQMLLSTFQCTSTSNVFWKDAGVICNSTSFVIQQAISAVLALSLFFLSVLFAAIYYESNSLSRFPDARAHGRADILMLVGQGALVLAGQTFYDAISTWIIIIVAAGAGLLWLGAYTTFMPYYHHYMNSANIAGASVFMWGVLCLTLNNYYEDGDAAVMLYCGAPIAAFAGLTLATYRATSIIKTPIPRLVNAFEVEIKTRYMLHDAIWGHPLESSGDSAAVSTARAATANAQTGDKTSGEEGAVDADLSDDVEDRIIQLRRLIPPELLVSVQQMYRQAATRFRMSGFLHVFCARFYATYLGNRHMQFSHLLQAEKRAPAADVSYLVFQARKLAEDTTGGGAGMSAMNRVTFEKYATDARKFVILAAQKQLAFWEELLESLPDLSRMHTLSTEINDAVLSAEKSFAELYAINPQSLAVIRLYAAFNTHVTGNLDKAMALTAEADRIEDMKAKDHSMEGNTRLQFLDESTLDVMAENTAILTVGAAARNLGLISAANAAACKVFGYARLQLERRSAFTLLPAPLDRFHEKAFKKYVNTGEGTIIDYSRIIFGVHKTGALIPLLSSVRDAPSESGPPSFIWLVRELRTQSQYIMLDETDVVVAATAGASTMLGLDVAALSSHEVRLRDYILEWTLPGVQQELTSTQGAVVKIEARVAVSAEEEQGGDSGSVDSADVAQGDRDPDGSSRDNEESPADHAVVNVPGAAPTRTELQEIWVRAHLQHAQLEDMEVWVVHVQRLASADPATTARLEQKRSEQLRAHEELQALALRSGDPIATRRASRDADMQGRRMSAQGQVRRNSQAQPRRSFQSPGPLMTILQSQIGAQNSSSSSVSPSNAAQEAAQRAAGAAKRGRAADERQRRLSGASRSEPPDVLAMLRLPGSASNATSPKVSYALHVSLPPIQPLESEEPRIHVAPQTDSLQPANPSSLTILTPPSNVKLNIAGNASRRILLGNDAPLPGNASRRILLGNNITPPGVASKRASVSNIPPLGIPSKRASFSTNVVDLVTSNCEPLHDAQNAIPTPPSECIGLDPRHSGGSHTGSILKLNSKGDIHPRSVNDHEGADARSSGASSKGTTVSKSMGRLRRLLTDGNRGLLPGLWWLRLVGIAITILAIVLASSVAIIARQSLLGYLDALNFVRNGADRLRIKAEMVYSMQDLIIHARNWVPLSEETIEDRRRNLATNASDFSAIQQEMFTASQESSMAAQYTNRYLTLTLFDAPPHGTDGTYIEMNLVDACTAFVNMMLKLSRQPIEEFGKVHQPMMDYVFYNWMRNGNGHEALQDTMAAGYGTILATKDGVYQTQIIVFISMTVLICFIGAFVFFPILSKIEASADNIMKQFVVLPMSVRVHMHQQALGRVKNLRREFAQDDDLDWTSSEEEEEEGGKPKDGSGAYMQEEKDTDSDEDKVDWDELLSSKVGSSSRRSRSSKSTSSQSSKRKPKQPYRKSGRSFLSLILRFIGPLVSLLAMFIIIFAVFARTLNDAVILTSIATAANYRAICGHEAMIGMRQLSISTAEWSYRRNLYWILKESAQCMLHNVRLMGYGDATGLDEAYAPYVPPIENGHGSVVTTEVANTIHEAMFGNACDFLQATQEEFNYTYCINVDGGYLTNGLAAASQEFYATMYREAEERLRVEFEVGHLQDGFGWSLPEGNGLHNNSGCHASERCYLRDVKMPPSGAVAPNPVNDFSWPGDINSTLTPPPEGSDPYHIHTEVNNHEMVWLEEADREYLNPGLFGIAELYEFETVNRIDSFVLFLSVFTPVYMITFVGIIVFMFMPQVIRTNMDINTKRAMLLYLPPQVVARIPSVKLMVDQILATDATHISGGSRKER